jgi:hypothetical protein
MDARPPQPDPVDAITTPCCGISSRCTRRAHEAALPNAIVFDGPVVRVTKRIEAAIGK